MHNQINASLALLDELVSKNRPEAKRQAEKVAGELSELRNTYRAQGVPRAIFDREDQRFAVYDALLKGLMR